MNKTISYMAGVASIILAYYALKDRGFFKGASGPVDAGLPATDPDPNEYWSDNQRWGHF